MTSRPIADHATRGSNPQVQRQRRPDTGDFSGDCLALDLEVGRRDGRIHSFGAVRSRSGQSMTFRAGDFARALEKLDEFSSGADYLLGHNLIDFDLPHLEAANPGLRLLKLPAIDTLRLNPLAFPRNPYHHLVKHYQDGQLKRGRVNDPELDARLSLEVFKDQWAALNKVAPGLLLAWHWLTTTGPGGEGFEAFFAALRDAPRPVEVEVNEAIRERLAGMVCLKQCQEILADTERHAWALAYALAWLSVCGSNSVMPPWVRHQFPEAGRLVQRLRDTRCMDAACTWCRERHDAVKELDRWFGFAGFRPEPVDGAGKPMQQAIVEAAMAGKSVLGILPTGTGKSICYQIPALSRYDKTGALTVVISPLVALMADQVAGLERRGIVSCVTVNGLLSMPERADALDRVRLGDAALLLISPEQLRNRSVRRALDQREIGAWVLDEAHCLSRWGHDFRPDYRFVARFIGERAGKELRRPPVMCLTATAKPDVKDEILSHFREKLDIGLAVFDGGTRRSNLEFAVVQTTGGEKFAHVHQILTADLPQDSLGGAIVYCATQRRTRELAEFLCAKSIAADHFHGGLPPETKKSVQQRFIGGELRVIVATNAFGMGIDKPNVRLVVHADIPGSLENYMQEAGRAGRDREEARCVLLYTPDDVERQFGLSARSRLARREIQGVLKALRNLDRKKHANGELVATPGEILGEDEDGAFERDSATDDTRVRTAVSWLEESELLSREENHVQVFPSSLRVGSEAEAKTRIDRKNILGSYRRQFLAIAGALIAADPDEGISTDDLMLASGLSAEGVRAALYDLERLGIASNDTVLTAFVHAGGSRTSRRRFEEATKLEIAMIEEMRETAPDLGKGEASALHLRVATQQLKDAGHTHALPELLARILFGLARDGRDEDGSLGSLGLRRRGPETLQVTLQREWQALVETAERRRTAAQCLLRHFLDRLPAGSRGTDLLAETTLGQLLNAIRSDLELRSRVKKPEKLLDRALLWLHEQEVIRLNKGLAIFRPAMSIRLNQERRSFLKADFMPLEFHYRDQVLQIHVMEEFAQRGLEKMTDALRLSMDYFSLKQEDFLRRWLPDRDRELSRQTTPDSWRRIVESLKNPRQQRIVADDREQTNVLVLAGPGSGKTRVLVHRIAYLIRVRRENPRGIIALAYNRHAVVEIRRRLAELVGDDARGVTVLTCHGLAMRLVGASFSGRAAQPDDDTFDKVMRQAVALLRGEGLPADETDEHRARLLSGFRWIFVDEYQDIGPEEYDLVSALAGRTLADEEDKLSLFAVGDDDQNVYAFDGASVEFIRRFEADYRAKPVFLTDNYRSTAHIVEAANALIEPAVQRMKAGYPIRLDRSRRTDARGGTWEELDPVSRGRVQVLSASTDSADQAWVAVKELQRLASRVEGWNWSRCAVIAREWKYLDPVRACCEIQGIPVQMGNEEFSGFWRLRETRALLRWLDRREPDIVAGTVLRTWLDEQGPGTWIELLREAVEGYVLETGDGDTPVGHFVEWLAEWGRDLRRRQRGLLLLTAHRAKGLEFDHVVVLDGGWNRVGSNEDPGAPRRLYYVSMTRARQTLGLIRSGDRHPLLETLASHPSILFRKSAERQRRFSVSSSALTSRGVGELSVRDTDATESFMRFGQEMASRYRRLAMSDVDLGFAGRHHRSHALHRTIAALSPGDQLQVRAASGRWELLDHSGKLVGRLARGFDPPSGMRCRSSSVLAVVEWDREVSGPEFQNGIRCDTWEVVVPELVFEPEE